MNTEDYVNLIDEKPAAGPIAPQENKYIQMLDDEELNNKTRLSASVSLAASSNPDEVARQKRLAELIGAPLPAVEGNPVMAKRMAMQKTLEADTKDAPALQQKYTDLDFAKLAHDQSANLGLVERTLRNAVAGVAGDFIGSGISGMGHTLHALERLTNSKSILADTFSEVGERTKKYWQGLAPTDQSFSDQVVRGVGQMAGQLPTMIVSAPLGIAMMYGQGADQMADKIANDKAAQKADQVNQDLEILSGGVITGITEWASSKLLLKIPQVNMLKSRLLNRAAQIATGGVEEGLQESMENIGQDLAHIAATNPESKVAFGEALEAGGVGAIVGTLASGVIQGALHIKARGTQKAFTDLSDATKNQKLKERDPGTYQDFADAVTSHLANTADGAVENIYIDANTFHQMMTEAQLDPAEVAKFVPSIAEQLDEARVTGGDLVIPLNEFVGKIAGTEVGDLLTPHLRSAPDAVSIAEMEAASKIGGDLQTKADEILSAQEKREEFVKSANEVQKTIFDQINATGTYTAPVSRAYASMVRDFYVTQAAKMGVSPMELYQQHPYKITSGELNQDDVTQGQINTETPEFKNWFGESKVVDEAGKPLVLHRGADRKVLSFDEGVTFFTPDKTAATNYAYERSEGGKGHILSAYLKMENPKVVDYREEDDRDVYQDAIDAQEEGHDGLIALNTDDGNKIIDQYVVFSPTQIKSVNNRGTWDPGDPNILNQTLEVRLPKLVKKERGFVESAKTAHDANPTAGVPKAFQNKKVVLTHWSKSAELTVADPKYHGSNHAGAEFGRSVPGQGSTQFYTRATFYGFGSYNKEIMVGPHRYGTVVDGNSLYDLDNDPLDLFPGGKYTLDTYGFTGTTARGELYDYRIAQAGFKGSASQHFQVAKLFSPAKVMPTTEGNKSLSQKALSSDIFYQASRATTDMIKKVAEENPNGFTVKVSDGSLQTSGFAVAPSKETELRLVKLTHDDLSTYLDMFQHVFETDERAFLGGWFDSENNEFVLDVSYIVDSEKEALYLAELGNQDAIFHLDKTEEIRTNDGIQRLKDSNSYSESERDGLRGVQEGLHQAIRGGGPTGQTGAVSGAGEAARNPGERVRAEGAIPAETGAPERSGSYPEAAAKPGNPWIKQSEVESNKGRTLLVQFTSDLMGSDVDTASRYYDKLYSGVREGYARLEDFWEIPQWIGQIANTIPNTDVYVVRDMQAAKNFLATSGYDHVAFSSLDVTIPLIKELAPSFPGDVSIGGYAHKEAFKDVNHKWYDSIEEMAKDYGHSYTQGTDYTHFQGSKVIPRLTMSQGCKYKCAFCTVPKKLDVSSKDFIDQQIESFADLDARLVYLNDKTFGQADNYRYLSELNARMKEANPKFEGFIIQTTASDLNKMPVDWLKKSGVKYVELGVESYNDFILKGLHKPHNEKIIDLATAKLRDLKINLVPNIIIGIPEETAATYDRTLQYLKKNLDIISHANIYNLALYDGTELEKKIGIKGEADTDENVRQKSFHTDETAHEDFSNKLFSLMTNALKKSPMAVLYQSSKGGYLFAEKALMDQSKKIQAALTTVVAEDLRAQITATKQDDGRYLAALGAPGDRLQAYGETEAAARAKLQKLLPYLTGRTIYQSVVRVAGSEDAAVKYLNGLGIKYQAGLFHQSSGRAYLAPNGKPSKLSPELWRLVRTPAFKNWFGDWEKGGVWGRDDVSKIVDENGEPLVAYHGTKQGGFSVMDPRRRDPHETPSVFFASERALAQTYSGKGGEIGLPIPKTRKDLEATGWEFEEMEGEVRRISPDGDDEYYETMEQAVAEALDFPLSTGGERGVYSVFLNIRNPMEDYFEGANWDGSREGQYMVRNEEGDPQNINGKFYVSEEEAAEFAEVNGGEVEEAWDHGDSTNSVVAQAKKYGHDGAIIRQVVDDGGQSGGYYDPEDVFVIFDAAQAKSATQNTGAFNPNDEDIRFQSVPSSGNKRGGFNPATLTTILTQRSEYSTFLHETAHFFLTSYADMASSPNATPAMQADMQTILDWFGVPDLATWNAMPLDEQRKHHEAFAYNYEIYLFEGKAPNAKMQSVFERFSAWLKKIYTSITTELNQIYRQEHGEDLPILTGEVKHVMDRMLASDNQIAQAEQVRGMAPLFTDQALSGMTDEEWAAYQDLQIEAHDAAISQHRTASLRQMKWLSNAKSKALKALQSTTQDIRRSVLAEVTEEVNNRHVYRAKELLKGANEVEALAIADSLGYLSVEDLKTGIANAPKKSDVIREEADRRMLEEYGELTDPVAFAKAVDEALHNEARARFIGVELRYLSKTTRPVRVMQEAARQAARAILGKRAIKDIRPRDYSAAEARYAAAAEKAMKKGDSAEAAQAKEHQLLQNQLAAEALKANTQVAKAAESFKRVFTSDKRLGKSRDMNYVNVARAILAHYGFGTTEEPASFYLAKIKSYDPEFFAEIEPMITAHQLQAKPFKDLTLEEFTDLTEQVQALWHISKRNKQIEIDGQLLDRKAVVEELNAETRDLTTSTDRPGYNKAMTNWQETKIKLLGIRASMRRVEAWADAMDRGKANGPFRRYIWNPISDAVVQYRMAKAEHLVKYLDLVKGVEPLLNKPDIAAPEIGYTFKPQELLHAILHTGNVSNKRKLLLGRGWATLNEDGKTMNTTNWEAFIARAQKEGLLTKEHYDFAQGVWNLLEQMKPAAQKAHRQMYGFYFAEITADPFDTPFGVYAGGYVPAVTDSNLVSEGAMRNEQETQAVDNSFMFPTTGRGFTKGRVEYNKPLLLNLGYLASHMDKVLRFTHIEPRVKDVARIVKTNKSFAEAMDGLDQTVRGDMLVPWLQRTAMQMVSMPSKGWGGKAADSIFRYLRTNAGMQMMVANVTNTLQQFTGISISALKVKPTLLRDALWQYIRQPGDTAQMAIDKSDYMKTRMTSVQYELQQTMDELLLNPTKYEKLQAFASKHGYFMQTATQGVVDTITWVGAYNQATEQNVGEKEAVRRADSAVRMTQGSFAPEDSSRIETGSPFVRAFSHFYSYFNMMANILGTEFANTARNLGVKKGAGRMFYIYAMGFMIPAVLSEMIVQAAGGFDAGDDDNYDLWDAMRLFFSAQARPIAAMVPGLGPAIIAGVNTFNSKPYDDRMSTSPAVSTIEATVRAPHSVYKAIAEDGSWSRASKDFLTGLGMITRLPLGQLGKPIGYLADVSQDKVAPESGMDVARGLLSGKDVNRKQ